MATDPLRLFTPRGETGYLFAVKPQDIIFEADRLRRDRHELHGDLTIRVNGSLQSARAVDGVLSSGAFNFSSTQARARHGKFLTERSGKDGAKLDWIGLLEEFCVRIGEAERNGRPAVALADVPNDERESGASWDFLGFPLPKFVPTAIYGLGDSGKSIFAMWLAGQLALTGVTVLYADWEMSATEHKARLGRLYTPMPSGVRYVRCEKPLVNEIDRLLRIVQTDRVGYVIFDSMIFALNGPADDEHAGEYFRAVRQLKCGSLHITHTSKADDDVKTMYGNVMFFNGARSVWFVQRVERAPKNELHFGLFHTKFNLGPKSAALGYRLIYGEDGTTIEPIAVRESDELIVRLPAFERLQHVLRFGPKTFSEIADEMNIKRPILKNLMIRHRSELTKTEGKPPRYGLASRDEESF